MRARAQGCDAKLREEDGKPYVTDNDNYIVDLYFTEPIKDSYQAGKEVHIVGSMQVCNATHMNNTYIHTSIE